MRIDETEQEDADIDWFAVDSAGHIVYFASGGGVLPESVAASEEVLLQLHQYFLTLPEPADATQVRVEANAERSGRSTEGFVRYARRGLFAFDKTLLNEHRDMRYHLVARPAQPLTVTQLPKDLATLLRRTQLPGPVAEATRISISTVL
jgi:hypothetical protein